MIPVILSTLFVIIISGITTIPLLVGLTAASAVIFKKSRVFLLALGLGLFADLISVRVLGYSSLMLTIFVFLIRLYERKFETQTIPFVFIATFLGSLIYLRIFDYQNIFLQSLVNSFFAVLFFKFSIRNSKFEMKI